MFLLVAKDDGVERKYMERAAREARERELEERYGERDVGSAAWTEQL